MHAHPEPLAQAGRAPTARPLLPRPRMPGVALVALVLAGVFAAGLPAHAKPPKRFGIEGRFVSYDPEARTFTVHVTSRKVGGFGGSSVGGRAPKDLEVNEEVVFSVKPEGSVLTRTVIKSAQGTALDKSGTREGFEQAVRAIPTDRSLAFSIERQRGDEGPGFEIKTVVIRLTPEELQRRFDELTEDP